MLYFEPLSHIHSGFVGQQTWTLLHFPLHLALLLVLSGASEFIALRAAIVRITSLLSRLPTLSFSQSDLISTSLKMEDDISQIILSAFDATRNLDEALHFAKSNNTAYLGLESLHNLANYGQPSATGDGSDAEQMLDARDEISPRPSTEDQAFTATNLIYSSLISTIYTAAGLSHAGSEPAISSLLASPASDLIAPVTNPSTSNATAAAIAMSEALGEMSQENENLHSVVRLIHVSFFIALGSSVLLMGLMHGIEKGRHGLELDHKIRLVTSTVVGLIICLLAGPEMVRRGSGATVAGKGWAARGGFNGFPYSAWVLPTAVVGLLILVFMQNVRLPGSPASVRRAFRRSIRSSKGEKRGKVGRFV